MGETEEIEENNNDKQQIEQTDEKEIKNGCFITLVVLIIVAVIFIYALMNMLSIMQNGGVNEKKRAKKPEETISVVIEEGSSVKTIAAQLKEAGVIDSTYAFMLKCKKDGITATFNPGNMSFKSNMNFYQIVSVLQQPNKDIEYNTFTINEGMTQTEIGEKLEQEGLARADEFYKECNEGDFEYDFIPDRTENRLEGYLYPDTYYFELDADVHTITDKILSRFDEVYTREYTQRANEMGYTTDQIITVASLIEAEIRYPDERKTAASVIYNRLEQGMKLQLDATVLYALGEHKQRVMESDLQTPSPYNTYYVEGLPQGPIGNPGNECIKAALYPDDTNYIYYVVEDEETGQHYFTGSYDDFLQAKEKYVSKFD